MCSRLKINHQYLKCTNIFQHKKYLLFDTYFKYVNFVTIETKLHDMNKL